MVKNAKPIPLDLIEHVEYCGDIPQGLRWKKLLKKTSQAKIGDPCGRLSAYWQTGFSSKLYMNHHIIWVMHFGQIPEGYTIDHIDRNVSNNNIDNLRLATDEMQNTNRGILRSNSSGVSGVSFNQRHKKWRAFIRVDGQNIYLGSFPSFEDAVSARRSAELIKLQVLQSTNH